MEQPRDERGRYMQNKNVEVQDGAPKYDGRSDDSWADFVDEGIKVDMEPVNSELFKEMADPFNETFANVTSVTLKGIHFEGFGTVFGGPYKLKPMGMKGIKLASEIPLDADYTVSIKDFSTPTNDQMDKAILMSLKFLQETGSVYVGCMMGQGRTGMFMACLLKVFGYDVPITAARDLYNPKAVETQQQEFFVQDYPVEKFEYLIRFMLKNQ